LGSGYRLLRFLSLLVIADCLSGETVARGENVGKSKLSSVIEKLGVSGSLRGAYWSNERTFTPKEHLGVGSVWLKFEPDLLSGIRLYAEGWVRDENLFRRGGVKADLREGYIDFTLSDFDLRAGRQITVWGKADFSNPTDNLSPRNYTLLVTEESDQRTGNFTLRAAYNSGNLRVIGYWLPEYRPHTVPVPPLPAGVSLRERSPKKSWNQWALRVEETGGRVDWSISYFDGYDRNPDLTLGSGFRLSVIHPRIRVLGADAATNLGRFGLRGEAAYTFTEDNDGSNPFVKNSFLYFVLGADRSFFEHLNVNAQTIYRRVMNFQDPKSLSNPALQALSIQAALLNNQFDQDQYGISSRAGYKWFNDTLETEMLGLIWLTHRDYFLRPKMAYAVTDHFRVTAAVELFRGEAQSFLGRLKDFSVGYVELRYDF
jgi:uncharacterized protein DUF1302